jgi:uncharacterized phage protein gp47/JayE
MALADLAYIDDTGFHYADYPTVLEYYKSSYRAIYGQDTYLEPDSQDGQWLAIEAAAIYDAISLAADVYNSYSPSTAQRDALSRNVKINGLRRKIPSRSTVDLLLVGQVGSTITNGAAEDEASVKWELPPSVTFPPSGSITITATATVDGAIRAPAGSVNKISTPTRGWQSVTNPSDAAPGRPVEEDAELRLRQSQASALPSRTVVQGIISAVANLDGVSRLRLYENDTKVTDIDGLPANSVALVVEGGDSTEIAQTLAVKKTPGGYTFGTVEVDVTDTYGLPMKVRISRPMYDTITATFNIKTLSGYTTATGDAIRKAVSDYINAIAIGGGVSKTVEWGDAISVANSVGGGVTFKVTGLTLEGPDGPGSPDVAVAFNHAAQAQPSDIILLET